MTDAEELAVLREFAQANRGTWTCMGDFYIGTTLQGGWVARRVCDSRLRGVSYNEGAVLAESTSLAPCILAARAKLQAERDAKDAPRLREAVNAFLEKFKVGAPIEEAWQAVDELRKLVKETP